MKQQELIEAKLKLGLNIKEFAEALNTPYRTVQDWLAGRRRIPGIVKIALKGIET